MEMRVIKPYFVLFCFAIVAAFEPTHLFYSTPNVVNLGINDTYYVPRITLEVFNQIKVGMTYDEVVNILGAKGILQQEAKLGGYKIEIYSWEVDTNFGTNAFVTFQNEIVIAKSIGNEPLLARPSQVIVSSSNS